MSDERLGAWLDGELSPAQHAETTAWLHAHPEAEARVRHWVRDQAGLRVALAGALAEPVPPRLAALLAVPARHAHLPTPRWWALAAVLMLASGLAGAWWAQGVERGQQASRLASGWWQRAAVAHAVYVPEQRHPVEVSVRDGDAATQRAQEDHLARWLTKRLDLPVALFDLRAQGFALVGGRLLPDARGPGAQLMYQRADGRRITVYLRRPDADTPAAFHYEQVNGLGLFYWVEAGAGYALVGDLQRTELLALAEAIHAQGGGTPR